MLAMTVAPAPGVSHLPHCALPTSALVRSCPGWHAGRSPESNSILGHFRASEECHGDNLRGVTSMTDSQDAPMRQTRPMTGDEYIDSLRDDREIFLYGERVKDVTTHPAFHNPIRM